MSKSSATTKRDVILLLSIPLALMVLLAAIVYLPQILARPGHDFIFSHCSSYRCKDAVSVKDGVVSLQSANSADYYESTSPTLYYYDVAAGTYRQLTVEEAQAYRLDSTQRSPDGYVLKRESSSSGFLFWSDSNSGWVLQNGWYKKPVDLVDGQRYYDNDMKFVGWVK